MMATPIVKAPTKWDGLVKIKDTDCCPYCGSTDIESGFSDSYDDSNFQGVDWIEETPVDCNSCGGRWYDVNMCSYVGFATYADPDLLPKKSTTKTKKPTSRGKVR